MVFSLNRVRILPTTTAKGLLSEIDTDNEKEIMIQESVIFMF